MKLMMILAALLFSVPAIAADDGGFGSAKFPVAAPAALGDYVAGDLSVDPSAIEPAAGDEAPLEAASAVDPASVSAPAVETPDTKAAPKE